MRLAFWRRPKRLETVRIIDVGPDDVLVVSTNERLSQEQRERIRAHFAAAFDVMPNRVIVLEMMGVTVMHKTPPAATIRPVDPPLLKGC